jgi:hypothetical protein
VSLRHVLSFTARSAEPIPCAVKLTRCLAPQRSLGLSRKAVRVAAAKFAPKGAVVTAVPFARLHVSMSRTVPLRLPMLDAVASKVNAMQCLLQRVTSRALAH